MLLGTSVWRYPTRLQMFAKPLPSLSGLNYSRTPSQMTQQIGRQDRVISNPAHVTGSTSDQTKTNEVSMDLSDSRGDQLEIEADWIANMIQAWQDEEFLKQDCHEALGLAAAAAYCLARNSVADVGDKCDYSNILLPILEELQHFDYTHTFTGPFDVANKVVELIMVNEGQEVCCQSAADTDRLERFGTAKGRTCDNV